jgi:hypothetical protein
MIEFPSFPTYSFHHLGATFQDNFAQVNPDDFGDLAPIIGSFNLR